ncbi:uncharacterized protein LOC133324116 [Musca vetustissima]|uniref:uncharacterized protein LOC133324116 n=1 Tax=Musca vetustissima TaxID=27455 RepID=UPI002AB6AE07|nr:uncharacterized protein LOC133324116 [Musca vetustissima]
MTALLKITKLLPIATRSLLQKSVAPTNLKQYRNISCTATQWFNERLPRPATSLAKEQQYMKIDRVPSDYSLIYRSTMENYVAWSMHVSSITATIIGGAAAYQYASGEPLMDPSLVDTKLVMHTEDIYVFALGFLVINAVLRLVVSKFPLRIYKNNDGKYLAVYHSQFPGGVTHHHFDQGDVKEVTYTFSPWNGSTYKLGNKTSLILDNYFKTAWEFEQMLTPPKKEE